VNASTNQLDPKVHTRIFREAIAPDFLAQKVAHERPKAIILGGQPGAGKGNLARAAEVELRGDAVKIDPDALRDYHPRVNEFRASNPYSWPGLTHNDASAWADELRQAATAGRKNFIFDTTLSHGTWTADLINDLQKKGYNVEVRVVAAHKLESEYGVDNRYSGKLDRDGHGRYVPEGARAAIYDKVPASLDIIHSQTSAPIRIFNREGRELYDSRVDKAPPGQVLKEAREARLQDPKITRELSRDWKTQVAWHNDLPESMAHRSNIASGTAQQLLIERGELKVVEGVMRDAKLASSVDYAVRVHPNVVRGVGAAGIAAVVYDAATTASRAAGLVQEGHQIGAQSQVEHFAGRTAGGLAGGFGAGFVYGAIAGSETGPGAIATGLVGGAIGAFGGEQLMDWHDRNKIYQQTDPHGQTWRYDAALPQQGWTRDVPPLPGAPHGQHLRADSALAERLTYQASTTAAELAMAREGSPVDPYRQPSSSKDTPSFGDPPWQRSAQTGQWERTIQTAFVERQAIPDVRTEVASPARASALDATARDTIARNLVASSHGIAEQYQAAYAQNHWQRFGPMPEAVIHALRTPPTTLEASNGHTYTRSAQGQWTTPGTLYGTNIAEGNVRQELEATYATRVAADQARGALAQEPMAPAPSAYVRDLPDKLDRFEKAIQVGDRAAVMKEVGHVYQSPAWQTDYGRARALAAKDEQQRDQQRAQYPRDPRDAGHPDHTMNQNIRQQVETLHERAGIFISNRELDHLTASVAKDARRQGMNRVDQLQFNTDKSALIATQQSNTQDMFSKHSATSIQQAMQAPPNHAYQQMAQETQRQTQVQQSIQQQAAQSQQGPSLGR